MDPRQQRGLLIALAKRVRFNGSAWKVPSQSEPGTYTVDGHSETCTCSDYETHGGRCKHIFAVLYTWGRIPMPDDSNVSAEQPRVTYSQDNWPAYNAAQRFEKAVVVQLLRGLCERIKQPPYKGRGRPPIPLADMVFAMTMKVYGGMSGRRSMTDISESLNGRVPTYNSIFRAMQREDLTPLLTSLVEASAAPLAAIERDFSVDATGFATSTYARWYDEKYGRDRRKQKWVKAHAMVGNETNIITAIVVTDGDSNDCPEMPGLVESTAERFDVKEVQGDKAYLAHYNLEAIESVGAVPFIPFKINSRGEGSHGKCSEAWRRMWHMYSERRDEFLAHYHRRSNSESTFSAVKRLMGAAVRSKKFEAQRNEVILKVLAYNLTVVGRSMRMLGVDPGFGIAAQECGELPNNVIHFAPL